jgi:ComF family protein
MFLSKAGKIFLDAAENVLSFPCPYCGVNPSGREKCLFCENCARKISFVTPPFCPSCGSDLDGVLEICGKCMKDDKRPWDKAVSVFRMQGEGKKTIHKLKYNDFPVLARPLGYLAAGELEKRNVKADFIVPVPLHWSRRFLRGFNQSALISRIIGEYSGIPLKQIMKRRRKTMQQASLDREQRKKNMSGAFSLVKDEILKNRTILLVDDVMTTGSTLASAAKTLLEAGAKKVNVLVMARR